MRYIRAIIVTSILAGLTAGAFLLATILGRDETDVRPGN